MKNKTANNKKNDRKITRKQALQKVGITALTAASIMFLSTKQSAAASDSAANPGGDW
jgi:hypothetical protein